MILGKLNCSFNAVLAATAISCCSALAETYTATNVVVEPLVDTYWTQNAPYNDYSPKGTTVFTSGWEAGCVATAAAQELYYWQWPWRLDAVHETSHPVLNESNLSLRFDGNVPFDWESMQNSYGDGATLKQKHAVAHLVLACQSLVQMRFVSGGGEAMKNLPGTMEWFEYAGQVTPRASEANLAALREDMEFGSPVQTGINFKGYGGHEVIGLGYATGTNSVGDAKNLIWLNLGWGGGSDGWYDIGETDSGETIIKSVQLGFRPIKSVQIEPIAPVSGNSVTLNWHLPNCYTNKISGFAVAKKTPSTSTTTWTDDFSTGGKGRSSNTNEVIVVNERLYGWQGTASGVYTYDEVLQLTKSSVLSYKYHDDYMAGMSVRVEAKIGDGAWQTISEPSLHGGWNYAAATTETVNLGAYAGKGARFRFVVEYVNASIWSTGVNAANVWFDDLSVSNVKTFETVASDGTIAASARSTTFSELTAGETYAFSVTPIMSDNSAAVTQTATTTIGTPAATPTIDAVTMSPKGSNLVQEGFYADIAMGWNIIDVACSESVNSLEAFISHQSVLPQSKIEVVDNGSGSFSINIDATEIAAKWANQKMILTLKATNATGESAYKDVELCLKASGVPENVPGGKVWTGASAMIGAENYTAKWSGNVLPTDGDKVTFKTTDADLGGEMNLNLSTSTTLGYVYATGLGQLTISGTSSETLTANVLKNDIQVEVNSSKFKVNKAIPSANIVIDNGSCLDCEIDHERSGYIKKVSSGYVSALTDSSLWKGTVVFSGYSAEWLNPGDYGNVSSKVRLNGVSGYLAHSNPTFNPTIELVDDGSTPAFDWNNGAGASTATFKGISGDGTFKTSGSGGAAEKIVINDIGGFTGSFNLASKVVTIGTAKGTDASNGRLNFNSGYGATIVGGKTWTIGGGVYLAGSQTLAVNGALSDSGPLSADGTGTVLSLAPTATVTAASLSFANNTIRLSKTSEASPTFSVTGAANLTSATIDVALADGMSAGDSIALMSAGSFEGVDSATLEGLDGYSLIVSGGTLYATKPAEIESPVAAAVWEDDFSEAALSGFDGFSIVDWQQTHGANMSSVTIDRANQGLLVDFTEAVGYVTVLVKYSNLNASSSNKRVLFATTANSDYTRDRCGVRLLTSGAVQGLWNDKTNANNDVDYGTASTDAVPSAGTLAFVYDKTSGTDAGGVSAYVAASGESLPDSVLWNNHALKAGDIYGLAVGGMCREAAVSGVEAAQGMAITGLAVFTNVLTVAEMNAYKWPSQLPPVDKEKYAVTPEAVWYKDFKTTAKTNDAGRVYTLAVSGTTAPADDAYGSTLTIGDSAAVIDAESAEALTVLVKYRTAPAIQSSPVVTFGGDAAVTFDSGICTDTSVDRQLAAYYSFIYNNSRMRGINAVDGNPTLSSDGGYVVCARKYNACHAYVGDSLDNMTGGECTTGMQISNSTLRKIGIGGQTELSNNDANMVPFTGFVVEKVVVFNGYYTPDQIRYVAIPEDADTLAIGNGKTWNFAAGTTRTYTNIGTLSAGGTIAVTNASEISEGSYMLATWTTAQKKSTGYGHVGTLDVTGLPAGLSAELVYGARAIYLRVWNPTTQAAKGTIKVWPYGDSITEGFNAGGTRANYRVLLAQKLSMLGYNVEMVGCYDKINNVDGIDPSGQVISDAWKWHSAKHGATSGPTTSAAGRANLCENVDTLSAQAGNPDVVLLLAGANDIVPATGLSAQQVVSSITNIVAHLAANLPDTKIVVGTQINVESGYNSGNYAHVTNMIPQVNALLKAYTGALPEALNGKVFLADLNSYVKSGEYGILFDHGSDHLHPDWWGHDQMAEGWLSIITNQFTSTQNFPSATIPAAPTTGELGAAAKAELADYRSGYTLCRTIEAASTNVPTVVTGEGATEGIEKVAYFVEYVRADNNAHKWVWVDMDAFGTTIGDVGLPTANHQQVVTKLHIKSNHNGINDVAANDDTVTGFVEFSPFGYTGNASGVSDAPEGNGNCCDWNDTLSESGSYSCMQVHRISPGAAADGVTRGGQVLFAYNNWQSSSSAAEFGIGNFSSHFYRGANDAQTLDYTYTANATKMNASAYSVKRIEIWTKGATPAYVRDNIVKLADGTVYHGNDANRAVITNWQCQINRPAAPPAPNTIDILYVLDRPSREYIEGTKNMSLDEFFARETAFMNEMLCRTDMDTNFWFRMVGVYPLDVQAQEVSPMLGRCKNSSEPGFELVNEVRNRVGADIVFSVARNGGGIGGLAYVNSYENIVSGAAAPLGHACGFLEYYDMISWIHEIAHVMSCNHMPPTNIDVNNPRHRQFGVVVHDDNATEAPFDYRTIMTGYYYAGQTWCFSSRNHYYNGVQLSVSNHVDATQVMVELAPYVAQWRPTKVPERPEISFFPQNYAEIPAGVETTVTIDYGDSDAEIYWYDATSGEGKSDAHPYTGPISVVGGTWKMLYAFAKTNGVEVAESEKTATYFPTGMYGQFDYSVVLDSSGIAWSMPLADSSEFAWDKDTQIFCVGESSYQAHVDMESLTNSRPSTCSATARLTLTEAKNLNFRHRDSYTNAMFSVWVDDVPVYYKNGASDTSGEWRKEVIRIEPGTHRIEFIFTQTAEDRVDAQTSEDDDHTLVDDEKYQRYIASLVAAETSRVWIDGLEWTPADLIWAGDATTGDGVWSKDTSYTPWEGEVPFADDAVTTFPDLASGSSTVSVKGEVRPGKVNFTGVNTTYTIVPEDDNAFIYISNGSSIEFKTNATIKVPFRLDAGQIKSAASRTLELGNVFGNNLSGPGNQGAFSGQIAVNSQSTVIMNPGAGRVQTVGDFGKNWSFTNSDLVFTNGTVKVNGAINGGAGLFQYKRIHVKDGAVLELVTNDATGYDVAGNNTIEVERGGELKIDAGDRLRRPMKLLGGTLTVSRSGSVHALALYNAPSFTVTADSVLTNGNAAATLGFVGQDATITLQNDATLDCYVPFANGIMDGDSKNVTIAGSGTFVQNAVMMQFTNKVTIANGVTFRQNEVTFGMVGKSSWDVNGTLEANAIMQVNAMTLASGATLSVRVTDANLSNAAILCDATPSLAGVINVDAASNLANGKYAVISATGLDDGILGRVSAPALAKRATFAVEDGGLFMTVADYVDDATTDTSYPVPYSWMMDYYPALRGNASECTELQALQPSASAAHAVWECYVLGLDPTNEVSKFVTTIRMDGETPIVEYSPTNEVLKSSGAISYILQGKPALTNGWQNVQFDEPGNTNRFFRVKVTW